MKNILSVLVGLLVVLGCTGPGPNKQQAAPTIVKELSNNSDYYNQNYQIYTLEGCEYVVADYGSSRWGSHKGNCKNPIHYKK
jgi:hypothetical protein